jgi:hypothetical protein
MLKLRKFCLVLTAVTMLWSQSVWANITLDNIIGMHKAGLPADVIIQTIKSSNVTFTLSLADKKNLEQAGVSKAVIDAMLATSKSASPEPEPEPEQKAKLENTQSQTAEQAKIQEAMRKAKEAAEAELKQEDIKRVENELAGAKEAFKNGNYAKAASMYESFLKNADTSKATTKLGLLGLADSLYALQLYGNASALYEELLKSGPESPVFEPAFRKLRACSQMLSNNRVSLASLADHFIGSFSAEFQDSYNFFLGKFFFNSGSLEEAKRYLGEVKAGADFAKAQYTLGLVAVQEAGTDIGSLIQANKYFQTAISSAESFKDDVEMNKLATLGYLALARLAYTIGSDVPDSYDAAIYYYRQIPSDSNNYVHALYESAWAYFLKGNFRRGMGIFHALESPDWANYYLPDTYLLEAQVFLNLCRTDMAREAIARLKSKYLTLKPELEQYVQVYGEEPTKLYNAFVLGQLEQNRDLPRVLKLAILSNHLFYELYTDVSKYKNEVNSIESNSASFGSDLTQKLLSKVQERESEDQNYLGTEIKNLLMGLKDELGQLEEKVTEMEIEIDAQASQKLEDEIASLNKGQVVVSEEQKAAVAQETTALLIGDRYVTWPFEKEFWLDEINNYRSALTSQCPADLAGGENK